MRSVPFSAKFEEMNEKYYKKNIGCLMTIEGLQFHSMSDYTCSCLLIPAII